MEGGVDRITPTVIEARRAELQLEPHRLAWLRIRRALEATGDDPAERAELAAEIRAALRLIDEPDVRGTLAREAAELARARGIEVRASEILTALKLEQTERAGPLENGKQPQGRQLLTADPEPWSQPVVGIDVAEELRDVVERHVALPDGAAIASVLWILHAHAHRAATISPLLALTSPEKRCGKTTLLTLIGALVPRPATTANITSAALFRAVERFCPTLLIDEADAFLAGKNAQDEIRGLLNSGHTRATARAIRTVGDDFEPREFSTWCPKAIALIGKLPPTLEDRAINIQMRRRAADEQLERLRIDRLDGLEPLRRRAWTWARGTLGQLQEADPDVPTELHDRAADNWRPLLAIADAIGGPWRASGRTAARLLSPTTNDEESSAGILLLADLRELFDRRGVKTLFSGDIVDELVQREDRPWPEWRRGTPITQRGIARLLAPFGIRPKQIWEDGQNRRGYRRSDLQETFLRYLGAGSLDALEASQQAGFPGSGEPLGESGPSGCGRGGEPHQEGDLAAYQSKRGVETPEERNQGGLIWDN